MDYYPQAASINLKVSLEPDPCIRQKPLNFHERTEMRLKDDENILQQELQRFEDFIMKN